MKKLLFATAAAFSLATSAHAATLFVGSWNVYDDNAPAWNSAPPNGPLAYTGQEAAAFLFGGVASDYVISTTGNQVSGIDYNAWYDIIGLGVATIFAQDYSNKYLGQFYGPTDGYTTDGNGAASAFIRDNLSGGDSINYAFRVTSNVPEPTTWAMLIVGFGLTGAAMRRRNQAVRVTFG